MHLQYWTICKCFIDKITFSWHTYYTYPTHKCSLNQCHWNFFHSEIFVIFQIFPKSIFYRNFRIKNFSGIGGYMATSVPLKFFTSATEIFWFSRIQYKILSRKRTKYTEFASRIFGEATSVFGLKFIFISKYRIFFWSFAPRPPIFATKNFSRR